MASVVQTPQSERDMRITKAQALRDMGINPYAQKFDKTSMIGDHLTKYEKNITDGNVSPFRDINDIIAGPVANVSTAGRLTLYRTHGKLSFGKLMDESGEIQVMWHKDACGLISQQKQEKQKRTHVCAILVDEKKNILMQLRDSSAPTMA
jgi:lysyl-tRNA synthetase class II